MRMKIFRLSIRVMLWLIITIGEIYYGFNREPVLALFDYIQEHNNDFGDYVINETNRIISKKRKKYERKLNKGKES